MLLAATNRPEILDPALLRAGRFDRQVLVDRPDRTGRDADPRGARAEGEARARREARAGRGAHARLHRRGPREPRERGGAASPRAAAATRSRWSDFTVAIERIVAGLEKKNRLLNPREREIVAHHEMGHALVAAALPGCDPVHKISIIPRGIGALGYTIQRPTEDRYLMTREELEEKMAVLLGGRAAEHVVFGHLSTGAADDLAKATDIARNMVTRYGMVRRARPASTYETEPNGFLGQARRDAAALREETAREIDVARARDRRGRVRARARAILAANRALLEESARELLAQGDARRRRARRSARRASAEEAPARRRRDAASDGSNHCWAGLRSAWQPGSGASTLARRDPRALDSTRGPDRWFTPSRVLEDLWTVARGVAHARRGARARAATSCSTSATCAPRSAGSAFIWLAPVVGARRLRSSSA